MIPTNFNISALLDAAHVLRDAAATLSFEDFAAALKETVGADESYARDVFISFQNNPAAFLASRNPQTQSVEIIRRILTTHSSWTDTPPSD